MGKSKTKSRSGSGKDILHTTSAHVKSTSRSKHQSKSIEDLLTQAATLLQQSQPELALPLAEEALKRLEAEREHYADLDALLKQSATGQPTFPEALVQVAEIYLALGGIDEARRLFSRATTVDPHGGVTSAEPWLELAQLSEEGGHDSIKCFEKALEVLKNEVDVLEEGLEGLQEQESTQSQQFVDERRTKIADALCAMAEIYMTDLSWDDDAEVRCERYVTEALAICPERLSAGVLQTLASVRISQEKFDEARQALARSMLVWKDLPDEVEDPSRPDFAARISLARLLMDVEAEVEAAQVLEKLVKEDDQSVECLYLGGWCQVLLSQKPGVTETDRHAHQEQARLWLGNCLKLYEAQDYEDDRLRDHTLELVADLNQVLGIVDDDEEWEDQEGEDDDNDDEDDGNTELDVVADAADNHTDGDVEMT